MDGDGSAGQVPGSGSARGDMPMEVGRAVLAVSGLGYPLTQLALRRLGRTGAAVVEGVAVGLLVRDAGLIAAGAPRRLRRGPAGLLWAEALAAAVAAAAGLALVRSAEARVEAVKGRPATRLEAVRRASIGVLFGLHTLRFRIYLRPDHGLRPIESRSQRSERIVMADPETRYIPSGWFMRRVVNPVVVRLGGVLVLVVPGRRSGELRPVPLGAPFEIDGTLYLVAGRGETHWVRNLRAAGGGEIRLRGSGRPFRSVELDAPERDRVLDLYRTRLGRRVAALFRALPDPSDHPVFRVDWTD